MVWYVSGMLMMYLYLTTHTPDTGAQTVQCTWPYLPYVKMQRSTFADHYQGSVRVRYPQFPCGDSTYYGFVPLVYCYVVHHFQYVAIFCSLSHKRECGGALTSQRHTQLLASKAAHIFVASQRRIFIRHKRDNRTVVIISRTKTI